MIDSTQPVDTARVRRIRSRVPAAVIVLSAAVLAGCGSSASAPVPVAPRSSAQLLARSEAALGQIRTFHLHETGLDSSGLRISVSGDFSLPGRMNLTYKDGSAAFHLMLVGRDAYLKANRRYWRSQGLAANSVSTLAGRWVRLPAASAPGIAVFEAYTQRSTIGRCVIGTNLGTVTIAGDATVDGTPAIVLSARGDTPGSAPGRFYIAAGSSLPLRAIQTGPPQPGGTLDRACGQTQASNASSGPSIVDISRYDRPVHIGAPAGAIGLGTLRTRLEAGVPASVPSGAAGSAARAQATAMTGSWLATGRIVATHNFARLHVGMTYRRVWRIASVCAAGRCRVYLARTSNAGVLAAQLRWTAGHWAATFVSSSLCSDGTTSPDLARWTLSMRRSGLTAIEHTRGGGTCGPVATEVVVWQAHRPPAPPGSRAIS